MEDSDDYQSFFQQTVNCKLSRVILKSRTNLANISTANRGSSLYKKSIHYYIDRGLQCRWVWTLRRHGCSVSQKTTRNC